ncbi:GIY-YIG nuclease family protein [Alkalicoccobacillus murimartini]|uniref:Endonuclease n=1 Tax=Alkalicoccobacillus murimartini TaxID=171685 RepID=A0ABT9YPM4_9BACI|nr:GIY-YIG nuclease family protein [Alkalicoccobacillus murimartini]MDQ0209157.1 putative endonuclease [Alkalicoccobacillus murimartini]
MTEIHYVYIIQCRDHTWYTGYTNNLTKRLEMHTEGKGAKYTRGRGPFQLIWHEEFTNKTEAMQLEYALKRRSRSKKEEYVRERKGMADATANQLSD